MKYFTRSEWMILAGLFVLSFIPFPQVYSVL